MRSRRRRLWLIDRSAPFDYGLRPSAQDASLGGLTDFEYTQFITVLSGSGTSGVTFSCKLTLTQRGRAYAVGQPSCVEASGGLAGAA